MYCSFEGIPKGPDASTRDEAAPSAPADIPLPSTEDQVPSTEDQIPSTEDQVFPSLFPSESPPPQISHYLPHSMPAFFPPQELPPMAYHWRYMEMRQISDLAPSSVQTPYKTMMMYCPVQNNDDVLSCTVALFPPNCRYIAYHCPFLMRCPTGRPLFP
jgi:hypothetical protein